MFNDLITNVTQLGIITADDVERLTAIELLILIIKRVNLLMESQKEIAEGIDERIKGIADEQKRLESRFDTLIKEGVMTDVIAILNEWKDSGLLTSLVSSQIMKNNRKVDFLVSPTPWHFSYDSGAETPNTYDKIVNQMTGHKKFGYDGAVIMVTIEPSSTGELAIKEGLECVKNYFRVCQEMRINVRCLKFHQPNNKWNESGFKENYARLVKETVNELSAMYQFDYITVFNEAVQLVYTNDSDIQQYVSSLLSELRMTGHLVGITGLGFQEHLTYPYLLSCQDALFPFDYRRVGYKDQFTTYEDCKLAYEELAKELSYWRQKLRKPIIISETGILPYWEMFRNPVYYATNDWKVDNSGLIQKMFFTYLFENKDINKCVDEVWLWYPDNMLDGNAPQTCVPFMNYYLQGGKTNETL